MEDIYKKVIEASRQNLSLVKSISKKAEEENRIPKIVHFCFVNYSDITELHLNYIKTWFEVLGDDWIFINWTPENTPPKTIFENMCLNIKNFAYYSDYIRCSKVYEYGGVYLDCDVNVIKPLDGLLDFDYMFDTVYSNFGEIECASFLAKRHNCFLYVLKEKYESITTQEFNNSVGKFVAPIFWSNIFYENNIHVDLKSSYDIFEYQKRILLDRDTLYTLDGTVLSCSMNSRRFKNIPDSYFEHTFTSHGFETTWN